MTKCLTEILSIYLSSIFYLLLLSIYIKKNVCLFVCLFFIRSVPVRASAAKLCMAYPYIQGKVKTGSAQPKRVQEGSRTRFFGKPTNIFLSFL